MTADKPNHRDQYQVGEHAAGAEDHGTAQSHDISKAKDEGDCIEFENHAGAVCEGMHQWHELEIYVFFPNLKRGDEEIVYARDRGCLQE